ARRLAMVPRAAAAPLARLEAARGIPALRLARLQRDADPARAGAGLTRARRGAGVVRGVDRRLPVGLVPRPDLPRLRAALRSPVLARVDRLPRHPRRVHAREGLRLLRELAARHVRAARLRDRQPLGLQGLWTRRLGVDRV